MKYIFLFFFTIGIVLLWGERIFAQKDTFTFTIKNLPVSDSWTHIDGRDFRGPTSYASGIDTIWNFSRTFVDVFDSSFYSAGRLLFLKGLEGGTLNIKFDKLTEKFDSLAYHQDDRGGDEISFSLQNTDALEQFQNIIGALNKDSFQSFAFEEHSFLYIIFNSQPYLDHSDSYLSLGVFTDSTIISFSITKQKLLGVKNLPIEIPFRVFPDPASNAISFQFENEAQNKITIFDLLGRNILSQTFQPGETATLDISSLTPGIYYVRSGSRMEKLVVAR
jgi:hypothetical protein